MNKVILIGRLTRDPEIRYSQGEQALHYGSHNYNYMLLKIQLRIINAKTGQLDFCYLFLLFQRHNNHLLSLYCSYCYNASIP